MDLGYHEKIYVLAGVGPLRLPKVLEFMRTKVPGVVIPDALADRMKKTPKERWGGRGHANLRGNDSTNS